MSALRSASSPVRITIYREDPESIFTSSEGNEWLHNNLYFIALIGNTYHSHIIILFCLFFLLIIILLLLFLFLRMYLSQRPCVPGIPWFMLYTFSLHSDTEPSAIFEVNLVKSITDYIGFSILARKYVLPNRYFVKKKQVSKFIYFIFIFSLFFFYPRRPLARWRISGKWHSFIFHCNVCYHQRETSEHLQNGINSWLLIRKRLFLYKLYMVDISFRITNPRSSGMTPFLFKYILNGVRDLQSFFVGTSINH